MQHSTPAAAIARGPATTDGASGPVRKSGASENVASGAIASDICVIGAGSGGLTVATAAAAFGRSVVLIESHKMGGDCLNFGCVPSRALHGGRPSAPSTCAPPARSASSLSSPRSTTAPCTLHVQKRHRRAGAELFGRALRRPRRARHPCRRPLHRQEDGRRRRAIASRRAASSSPPDRRRWCRRSRASTACPTSPTRRSSTTRKRSAQPHHHRRRPERARAGAGASPARQPRHRDRAGSTGARRARIPSSRPWCSKRFAPKASASSRTRRSSASRTSRRRAFDVHVAGERQRGMIEGSSPAAGRRTPGQHRRA